MTTPEHQALICNDLLDVSSIEAGTLVLEPISFDLRVALEEVADLLAPSAHEKGLELVVHTAPEVPRYLIGDAGRVRQILTNLARNAVKSTSRGHVLIAAELLEGSGDAAWVRFAVEDTGIGIGAERLAAGLGQFAQAEAGATERSDNTGLHLSISRQLVELMGGRIGLESVEGRGSTFWCELPLPADYAVRPILTPTTSLEGVRVLIVDSDGVSRQVLSEQLEMLRCRPSAVASGEEALAELGNADWSGDSYGLALLSVGLPDMDGGALGRLIKADARLHRTALLFLANQGRPGDGRRVYDEGFAAYLRKPLRQDDLTGALTLAWEVRDQETRWPLITRHSLAEARAVERPAPEGDTPAKAQRAAAGTRAAAPPLDVERLEEYRRMEGATPGLLAELVGLFLHDVPGRITALELGLTAADADQIHRAAHALRGAALQLGATPLALATEVLEREAKAGDLGEAHGRLERIVAEFARARDALLNYVSGGQPSAVA